MAIPQQKGLETIEKKLIESLLHPIDSIDVPLFPIRLVLDDYNPQRLAQLAEEYGIPNIVGYFAELARAIASETGKGKNTQHLDFLTRTLYEKRREDIMPTTPELPPYYVVGLKEHMDDLQRKWRVATSVTRETLSDYVDRYIQGDTRSHLYIKGVLQQPVVTNDRTKSP